LIKNKKEKEMSTILTKDQLKQMVKNPHIDHWYEVLEQLLDDYEINTPLRVAHFIAQCAHESGNFVFIKENLNYKAASLQKIFAKYFPTAELAATICQQTRTDCQQNLCFKNGQW
jgi:putative chitinase